MKNLLITRPKEASQELVQSLEKQGFAAFVEPLFLIEKLNFSKDFGSELSSIIITSSNAIPALLELELKKEIKIFAVGKRTAQKLTEIGFRNISFPQINSAAALKDLIVEEQKDKEGLILYLHGSIITIDFERELKRCGFNVKNIVVYKTIEAEEFSSRLLSFIKENKFEAVLIFSQNSARIFFNLVRKHNLLEYFDDSQILCLSKKILELLQELGFKKLKTFDQIPNLKNFYD